MSVIFESFIPAGLAAALLLSSLPLAADENPEFAVPDVRANVMKMLREGHSPAPGGDAAENRSPSAPEQEKPRTEPKPPPQPGVIRRRVEHTELPEKTITIREYLDVDDLEIAIDKANARREKAKTEKGDNGKRGRRD